jgi:hypothetical protein
VELRAATLAGAAPQEGTNRTRPHGTRVGHRMRHACLTPSARSGRIACKRDRPGGGLPFAPDSRWGAASRAPPTSAILAPLREVPAKLASQLPASPAFVVSIPAE